MYKTTAKIEGMSCGMCEAHICDVIRKTFPNAKKVSASHIKNIASFVTEDPIDSSVLEASIKDTGYIYKGCESEPFEKKQGLFSLHRRKN
ncbi:MAG: heavy-metal-associated domain-containing protein [Bilifractor sp.]